MTTKQILASLVFLAISAALAAPAQAQLVTYQFTGFKLSGSAGIGDTVSGEVTLNVGAAPDSEFNTPDYAYAVWYDGDFAIDAVTDTGIATGTSFFGGVYPVR